MLKCYLDQVYYRILNLNYFLLAVKLSAPSAAKMDSKRQKTEETIEGRVGSLCYAGLTFSILCFVHLDSGLSVAMCNLPLNWACTLMLTHLKINVFLWHYFVICLCRRCFVVYSV